jgi:hypothetical protein
VRGYARSERAVAYEQTQLDIPLEPVAVWLISLPSHFLNQQLDVV